MKTWKTTLAAAALILAACSPALPSESTLAPGGSEVETAAPQVTEFPSTASVNETPIAMPDSSQPVLVFARSGGIAGIQEQWTFYADGRVVDAAGNEHTLSQAEVASLVTEAGRVGFWNMGESFGLSDNCADCMLYSLTFSLDGQTKTVTTIDTASDAPEGLDQLVTSIQDLVQQAAGN